MPRRLMTLPAESRLFRGRVAAIVIAATLLAACAQQGDASPSAVAGQASPTATAEESAKAPWGKFAVDGDREMFVRCIGSGSPVILMDAGGGDDSTAWPPQMLHALAERTMVCAYDRAGTGQSDPAPDEPRSFADLQNDLDSLLEAAAILPPYVLVGQSFGGTSTLYHAMVHSENVAALVILDSDWPSSDPAKDPERTVLTDEQWAEAYGDGEQWDDAGNPEHIDFPNTSAEIEAVVHELPGVPIRILSATEPDECPSDWPCERIIEKSIQFQEQWLALSPDAVQILVEGGHNLHEDNPDVVIQEIITALDAIDS